MDEETLNALLKCPLLEGLKKAEINRLMQTVKYKLINLKKNDVYAFSGMPCKYADIIIEGEMAARMVGLSGKYVEVSRLRVGNVVAPAFIFAKENNMPVSVETETDILILRMMPSELKLLMDTNSIIRSNFISTLSNINVFLTHKMRLLSVLSVREKVSFFIMDMAEKQKSDNIHLHKSRQEIADTFGIQKFSLIRCMSELVKASAITIEGKNITILDKKKLKQF